MKIKAPPETSKGFIKTIVLVFLGIVAVSLNSNGAGKPFGMSCMIGGKFQVFDAKAVSAAEGGIELIGQAPPWAFLSINLPKARVGVQRSADTPGLCLHYSRDESSSNSRNHYSAGADIPDTRVEVTLSRVDSSTGIIEGEYSADAASFPPTDILHIRKGQFHLKISPQTIGELQNGAQPGGPANQGQPVSPQTNRTSSAAGSGR